MMLPRVEKGTVHVLFAFDIGFAIDLEGTRKHIAGLVEERILHKGHAPQYFQFDPRPLKLVREIECIEIGRASICVAPVADPRPGVAAEVTAPRSSSTPIAKTRPVVDIVLFDFGGVSVSFEISFAGAFEELIELSCALTAANELREAARREVARLVALVEPFVLRSALGEMNEDYHVFHVESFASPVELATLHEQHGDEIARLLRSERDSLSGQEIDEATSGRVSFGVNDVSIVDWNAALLVDREPQDTLAVLEFVNLQLLELRFLDAQLDRSLDRAYEVVQTPRRLVQFPWPRNARHELRRVGLMQADGAVLFERVQNALKLVGDQYLARVYRMASQRYRLDEWERGILRKLETIESIYQKLHDQSTGLRMEIMEFTVIVLIALEIVLSVFRH